MPYLPRGRSFLSDLASQENKNQESIPQKEDYGRLFYTGGIIASELGWYEIRLPTATFVSKLSLIEKKYKHTT